MSSFFNTFSAAAATAAALDFWTKLLQFIYPLSFVYMWGQFHMGLQGKNIFLFSPEVQKPRRPVKIVKNGNAKKRNIFSLTFLSLYFEIFKV